MFWRQILTRPVIPITSAVATTYFINDSQFQTVLAKDHEKVKVFGFRGSPDTHALLTYLNWAGISYEFENVNPFKLDNLEHLPCSKFLFGLFLHFSQASLKLVFSTSVGFFVIFF